MTHMRALYIVGAGGLGRETAVLVERFNASASANRKWQLKGFVDDDPALLDGEVLGHTVAGNVDWLTQQQDAWYILAIGASAARRSIAERLQTTARHAPALIDPTLFLHPSVSVGAGSLLYRGAVIMVAARLGRSVIVDVNATIGHDAEIGDYATIHPGANVSGHASVGAGVQLGAGSVVLPGISIGDGATVGAGAVVTRDLPPGCTAVGVPARPIDHSN